MDKKPVLTPKTALFLVILLSVLVVIGGASVLLKKPKPTVDPVPDPISKPTPNTQTEVSEDLPGFMTIEGLPTTKLFLDMNADFSYYGKVRRNPKAYHHLVDDKRIDNLADAKLIYQYHCYRFFQYSDSIDDMKCDFLGAFLEAYHGLSLSEIDKLAIEADQYVK